MNCLASRIVILVKLRRCEPAHIVATKKVVIASESEAIQVLLPQQKETEVTQLIFQSSDWAAIKPGLLRFRSQ